MFPIELDDLLAIAATVLNLTAAEILYVTKIDMAESALAAPWASFDGIDFYPTMPEKAGVLCSRLNRNHAFPDGNKRISYLSMLMFLDLNEWEWNPPSEDERGDVIEMLAARAVTEADFIDWLSSHIAPRVLG